MATEFKPQADKNNAAKSTLKNGRTAPAQVVVNRVVELNISRKKVSAIKIVDADILLELVDGSVVLVQDGAVRAVSETDFLVRFTDSDISGAQLFKDATAQSHTPESAALNSSVYVQTPEIVDGSVLRVSIPTEQGVSSWWKYGAGVMAAVAVGVGASGSKSASSELVAVVAPSLKITPVAGPFVNEQFVRIFDKDGNVIASGAAKNGVLDLKLPVGFSGAVLIEVIDINGDVVDYRDEATGTLLSLGSKSMRAFVNITSGASETSVSVTPVTEAAVRLAISDGSVTYPLSGAAPLTSSAIQAANDTVARAVGLTSIVGAVTPVIDANGNASSVFNVTDGVSASEAYGQVLAKLSGLSSVLAGKDVIDQLVTSVKESASPATASSVVDALSQGASAVSSNLQSLLSLNVASRTLDGKVPTTFAYSAAERATGVATLLDGSSNSNADSAKVLADHYLNSSEVGSASTTSLTVPVPLALGSVAGDRLTLKLMSKDGTVTVTVSQVLTQSDVAQTYASVDVSASNLSLLGQEAITAKARVASYDSTGNELLTTQDYDVSYTADGSAFVIDTTAPNVEFISIRLDQASHQVDKRTVTSDTTPILVGTAEAHAAVAVKLNGVIYKTNADSVGNWVVNVTEPLPSAAGLGTPYVPSVTVTDSAGNNTIFQGSAFSVVLDASVKLRSNAENDTGSATSDNLTNNTNPIFDITVPDGVSIIEVVLGGSTYSTVAEDPLYQISTTDTNRKNWYFTAFNLTDGRHEPLVNLTFTNGLAAALVGQTVVIDTTGPSANSITSAISNDSDTGVSRLDGITSNQTPVLMGTAEPGSKVRVEFLDRNGLVVQTLPSSSSITTSDSGTWSAATASLADGVYTTRITATDAAGNQTIKTVGSFTIDTTAPDLPISLSSAGALSSYSDTGVVGDNRTSEKKPEITGTSQPGTSVVVELRTAADGLGDVVQVNGGDLRFTTQADSSTGVWAFTVPSSKALSNGSYHVWVKAMDLAGNQSAYNGQLFEVLSSAPTVSLSTNVDSLIKLGDTRSVTFTFSTEPFDFNVDSITVVNGTISNLVATTSDRKIWQGELTPTSGIQGQVIVQIANGRFADAIGNKNQDGGDANNTLTMTVDTVPPTVAVTSSVAAVKAGDTATLTLTFSEAPVGLEVADITVPTGKGAISNLAVVSGSGGLQYTALYTPPSGVSAIDLQTVTLSIGNGVFTDAAGNPNADAADIDNKVSISVDTLVPVDPTISLRHDTVLASVNVGSDTDRITSRTQLTTTGAEATGTVEYKVVSVSGSTESLQKNWSSQLDYNDYMESASTPDGAYKVYVRQTDRAGNVSVGTSSLSFTKDTTIGSLSVALTSDTAGLGIGTSSDRITSNGNLTLTGAESGAQVQYKIGSGAWANSYAQSDLGADGVKSVQVRQVDVAGNVSDVQSIDFTLDTTRPGMTITSDRSAIKANDTATISFTFTEDPGISFTLSDLLVTGGTLSNLSTSGSVRTATFTPTAGSSLTSASIAMQAGASFLDAVGNTNTSVTALSLPMDTVPPTLVITEQTGKTALKGGETATLVFTFSEDPISFTASDINVTGGALGALSNRLGAGTTVNPYYFTAVFTPTAGSNSTATISVASERFSDAAGNANVDGEDANNLVTLNIDTIAPTVAVTSDISAVKAGQTATLTFTFSEVPTGFELADIHVPTGKGTVDTLQAVAGSNGLAYTARYTPPSGVNAIDIQYIDITVATNTFTDAAGNPNADGSDLNNKVTLSVDTLAPVISSVTVAGFDGNDQTKTSALVAGDKVKITVNLDQTVVVTGQPTYDLNLGGVVKQAVYDANSSSARQLVFVYTIRTGDSDSAGGIEVAANALTLVSGSNIKDEAGNVATLTASAVANTLSVDAIAPTLATTGSPISITSNAGVDKIYKAGDTVTVQVVFSETVNVSSSEQTGVNRPYVNLKVGSVQVPAYYTSGTGSNTLTFSYTIQAGDTDVDGLSFTANSVSLGVGNATIKDNAGNDARIASVAVTDNANHLVDTTAPTVQITRAGNHVVTLNSDTTSTNTETLTFTFSEDPSSSFSSADISISGSAGNISNLVQTADAKVWTALFTPASGKSGNFTVSVAAAGFQDPAGNNNTVSNSLSLTVDTVIPTAPVITLKEDTARALNTAGTNSDLLTSKTELTTTSFESGASLQYQITGGTGANAASGTWVDLSTYNTQMAALAEGAAYTVKVRQIDINGNIGTASSGLSITRDTTAAQLTLSLNNDTSNGLIANTADSISKDMAVNVSGQETGAVVQYRIGSSGTWLSQADYTTQIASELSGVKTVFARQIDKAGNISDLASVSIVLDKTAPLSSLISGALDRTSAMSDTGTLGDNITSNTRPTLTGTAESSSLVAVTIAGVTYTTTANASGVWSIAVGTGTNANQIVTGTAAPLDGSTQNGKTYTLSITVTDAAGNATTVNGTSFTVDATAPANPQIALSSSSDTGTQGDNKTNLLKPALEGTAEANAKIQVVVEGSTYTTYAGSDGSWIVNLTTALAEGSHTPQITVTDAAGNATSFTGTPVVVDFTAPVAPSGGLKSDSVNDTGISTADSLTNNQRPTLSGIAELGAAVDVTVNGVIYSTSADSQTGAWSVQVTNTLASGTYVPNIKVTDAAGNARSVNGTSFTVDIDLPSNGTVELTKDVTNDTGSYANDNLTNNATPTLSGTAERGAKVDVLLNGKTYTATADASTGLWTVSVPSADALPGSATAHTPQVRVTDKAGNSTSYVNGTPFIVDRTPPTVSVDYDVDGNGHSTLNSGKTATLTFTFSEAPVGFALADIVVSSNSSGVSYGTISNLVQDGANPLVYHATFTPRLGLNNQAVNISVASNVFADTAGNLNADGIDANNAVAISVNTLAPTVLSMAITGASSDGSLKSGTLVAGDKVHITVNMSDAVTVSNGTPSVQFLLNGGVLKTATYIGNGNLSNTLVFSYTVASEDNDDAGGIVTNVNALLTNGALIADATNNNAVLSVDAIAENTNSVRIDTKAPTVTISSDSSATLNTINHATLKFVFSEDPGTSFTKGDISLGGSGGTLGTLSDKLYDTTLGKYYYTITIAALPSQNTPVTVNVASSVFTDGAINANVASNILSLVVDTTSMPDPTGGLKHDANSDTGDSSTDNLTKNTTPYLSGTAETGALVDVTLTINGVNKTYNTVATGGAWLVQITDPLTSGVTYTPTIKATNSSNNSEQVSGTAFTVDTTAPTTPIGDIVHSANNDTGNSDSDNYTSQNKPTFVGTAERNAYVDITLGATTFNTKADDAGNWTLTVPAANALADGVYTPSIKITDAAGNFITSTLPAFTVDKTAPLSSSILAALSTDVVSDTGITGDNATGNTAPVIKGTAEEGARISVVIDGKTYVTTADASTGDWSIQIGSAPNAGHYLAAQQWTAQVTVTDKAGNTATKAATPFSIVTTLADPTVTLTNDTSNNSNFSSGGAADTVTKDVRLTVGNLVPGALVEYKITGGAGSSLFKSESDYLSEMNSLTDGTYSVVVRQKDVSGVYSPGNSQIVFTKDTTAATLSVTLTSDTGSSNADKYTSDAHINVSGAEPGAVVEYRIGSSGTWSTSYAVPTGAANNVFQTIQVRQTDKAGNVSNVSDFTFSLDNVAPDVALISGGLRLGTTFGDSGVQGDNITNITTPWLSGVAEANAKVTIALNSKTYTTTSDGSGNWSVQVPQVDALTNGQSYTPTITVTDAAGNQSTAAGSTFTIDITPPSLVITGLTGALATLKAGDTAPITFTFNEDPGTSFQLSDIIATGGSVSNLVQSSSDAKVWTADFSPRTNYEGSTSVSVTVGKYTDPSGNLNTVLVSSATGGVDTLAPTVIAATPVVISGETAGGVSKAEPLVVGDVVKVAVTFKETVKVTGTPDYLLVLNNGLTKSANYVSGSNSNTLIFKYTVASGDADNSGGITAYANSLGLGIDGTALITDVYGNYANLATPAVVVGANTLSIDTASPTIAITGMPAVMKAGDTATITFTFSDDPGSSFTASDVVVTGGTLSAWSAKTGTGIAADPYKYTATFTPNATSSGATSVSVASSKFTDAAGNLNLDGSDADNATTGIFDTIAPTVALSVFPASGTVKSGDTATLTLTFSEVPSGLSLSDITVPNGRGTVTNLVATSYKVYTLTYTPATGLSVQDVILNIASSTFTDSAGNLNADGSDTNNSVTIRIDTEAPKVSGAVFSAVDAFNASKTTTLIAGDKVRVEVTFTEAVMVTGTPEFMINLGGFNKSATYLSGTGTNKLVFFYTVVAGDNDSASGITSSANALSLGANGVITDAAGNNAITSILASATTATPTGNAPLLNALTVDTTPPVITISRSGTYTLTKDSAVTATNTETITFSFNEDPGTSFDASDITVSGGTLSALSTKTGTGSLSDPYKYTATFAPTSNSTTDATIQVLSAKFTDPAGNANGISNLVNLPVDTVKPAVLGSGAVVIKALDASGADLTATPRTLVVGDKLQVIVDMTDNVTVVGRPTFSIAVGANTRTATYDANLSDANTMVFTYAVVAGDLDNAGGITATINAIGLNTATVRDVNGNQADISTAVVSVGANTWAVDANTPTVSSLALATTGGGDSTYKTGDSLFVKVVFSKDIVITGSPYVNINIGGVIKQAVYDSANSSNTTTNKYFKYVIAAGDTDTDGISISAGALSAGSGTIADAANNTAILTHSAVSADAYNQLVDSTSPTVSISRSGTYVLTKNSTVSTNTELITFTFSEHPGTFSWSGTQGAVTVSGGTLGAISSLMGDGSAASPFKYTATFTPTAGSTTDASIKVLASAFTDTPGNNNTLSNTLTMAVDTTLPATLGIALSTDSFSTDNTSGTNVDLITNSMALTTSNIESGATVTYQVTKDPSGTLGSPVVVPWMPLASYNNYMASAIDGVYKVEARQVDSNGNIGVTSTALTFTKDTTVADLTLAITDSGNGNTGTATDSITNDPTLTVTPATVEAGTVVQYRIGSGSWLTQAQYNTAVAVGGSSAGDGTKVVTVRQIDQAGNVSGQTQLTFGLDRTKPADSLTSGSLTHDSTSDTAPATSGTSGTSDNITKNTTPYLSGTAEAGAKVTVTVNSIAYTTTADATSGVWSVQITTALPEGTYTPSIVVTDAAGNSQTAKNATSFTVDTTAPTIASITTDKPSIKAGETATVTFTTSEAVVDFGLDDIVVSGGVLSNFSKVSSTVYTAVFTPVQGINAGNASINVPLGVFTDVANTASAVAATTLSMTYDTSAPDIVSIVRGTSSLAGSYASDAYLNVSEVASGQTASFVLNFTESVSGLSTYNLNVTTSSGLIVNGLTLAVGANSPDANGRSKTWTVTVAGLNNAQADSLRLNLDNNTGIQDASGNTLISSSYAVGQAYTLDSVVPLVPALTTGATVGSTTPQITGQAEAFSAVIVTAGGATYTTTAASNGYWSIDTSAATTSSQIRAGSYTAPSSGGSLAITYLATDAAGNQGSSGSSTLTVNTNAPVINTSGSTFNTTPRIRGTALANAEVTVVIGGATYAVKANASGSWLVDTSAGSNASQTLSAGSFTPISNGTLQITATNASGDQTQTALIIDTTAPNAPQITSSTYSKTTMPVISGTADPFTTVQLVVGGGILSTKSDLNGNWSIDTAQGTTATQTRTAAFTPISSGTLTLRATAIDDAGNSSAAVRQTLNIDTTAPAAAALTLPSTTGDSTPVLTGTAEVGATVTVITGGATYKVVSGSDGKWSVDTGVVAPFTGVFTPPASGASLTVTASQTDRAGNVQTAAAASQTLTYDAFYPVITSSLYTNQYRPILSGTAQSGEAVTLTIAGATYQVTADANGLWSLDTSTSPNSGTFTALTGTSGVYSVTATVTVSGASKQTTQTLNLDKLAPSVTIDSIAIAGDNIINALEQSSTITGTVEAGATVTLTFGGLVRTATVKSDGSWVYQLNANDVAALGESSPSVTNDKSVIVSAKDRAGNTTLAARSLTIDTVAPMVDLDRSSSSSNWFVAMTAKNVEYSLDNGRTVAFTDSLVTESNPITKITIGIYPVVPTDGDSEYFLIADKQISTSGNNIPSSLSFAGVTWALSCNTGVLTLTAASTVSDSLPAQALLRNIRFIDTSAGVVSSSQPDRVFSFKLFDQAGNASATVTSTVTSDGVGPAIDLNGATSGNDNTQSAISTAQATAGLYLQSAAGMATVVETNGVASITITGVGLVDGVNETLLIGSTSIALSGSGQPTSVSDGTNTWNLATTVASATKSVSLLFNLAAGGLATAAQVQGLVQSLQYKNTTASDGSRVFTISAVDGVGNPTATPAVANLSINANLPAKAATNSLVAIDANNDGVLGDQFTISFTEPVKASLVTDTANWKVTPSLVNTTFTTDLSGWRTSGTVAYNSSSGERVVFNGGGNTVGNSISQDMRTVVGVSYTVSYTQYNSATTAMGLKLEALNGATVVQATTNTTTTTTATTFNLTFTATSTTTTLKFTDTAAAVSNDLYLDNVTLTASGETLANRLGTGGTITAINPVSIGGVLYDSQYKVSAGSGYSYTSGDQLTIQAANLLDTGGASAASAQTFVMTDVVAPAASTPPTSISTDNIINATERADSTSMVFTTATAAVAGDVMNVYRDGVFVKAVAMTAGQTSTTVTMTGNEWASTDGSLGITIRIQDAAGNLGAISAVKPVTIDTSVSSQITKFTFLTDNAPTGGLGASDVIQVTFGESVQLTTSMLPSATFGSTGLAVSAVSAVNGYANTWNITLGTGASLTAGGSITFGTGVAGSATQVLDLAGNRGTVTGTVPADVLNRPTSITIDNVATNNVVDGTERATAQSITMKLAGAKSGDVVTLFMDGVQVGTTTVTTNGQATASISVAASSWGADGEHLLTATTQRGSGVVVSTQGARSVYVAADGAHWSSSGILWFDPDTLSTTDTTFNTWTASAGGSIATRSGTTPPALVTGLNGGHQALNMATYSTTANKSFYTFSAPTGLNLPTNRNSISAFVASFQPKQDTNLNVFLRYGEDTYAGAIQLGIDNRAAGGNYRFSTLPQRLTLDLNDVYPFGADASGAVNNWVVAQYDTFNNNSNWAISSNGALNATGSFNQGSQPYVNFGSGSLRILGSNLNHSTNVLLGDEILASTQLNAAWAGEINTYLAAKYASQGIQVARAASNSYELSTSSNSSALIDQRLQLLDAASNDTVVVAGSDYVQTGAGNDTVTAKDNAFRLIDGGQGFDTFALSSAYTGSSSFVLTDYVSNARGTGSDTTANSRVNSNGFHNLQGFEHLDFSQNTDKQIVTIAAADVDQLAEKNLAGDPQAAASTSNLYVKLGSNDYLTPTGFGAVQYGYWLDQTGMVYDRKYTVTGSTIGTGDTANLFVLGGDMPLEFGNANTSVSYSAGAGITSFSFNLNESMGVSAAVAASEFTITSGSTTVTATSASLLGNNFAVGYSGGALSGVLNVQYNGTGLVDAQGDVLRYKNISIGTTVADSMDGSARSVDQALFAGTGNDIVKGGSGADLIVGGYGNDQLTGGAGADTFRFVTGETGTDIINDFNVTQGDKIDLSGILKSSAYTRANASLFLQLSVQGTDYTLKVDTLGIGNFSAPDQTITFISPVNVNSSIDALLDNRVIFA